MGFVYFIAGQAGLSEPQRISSTPVSFMGWSIDEDELIRLPRKTINQQKKRLDFQRLTNSSNQIYRDPFYSSTHLTMLILFQHNCQQKVFAKPCEEKTWWVVEIS